MSKLHLRILIVDDHQLIREGLKRVLLEETPDREIVEASTAREALGLIARERWAIVILDLSLPDRPGLDVLKEIKSVRPGLPVLVLTILPEEQVALRVLRAGADGFLSKASASSDLAKAVNQIVAGGKHVSPAVSARLIEGLRPRGAGIGHENLSDREDEVFRSLATGLTVGETAVRLGLSVKTVSSYRVNTLRKLGLKNNAQLIAYAHRHGLVQM